MSCIPPYRFRPAASATMIAITLVGCATPPRGNDQNGRQSASPSNETSQTEQSDPCTNKSRNIGIAVGAIGGALLGKYLGENKRGALIGAGVGALVGGFIGADMDRKRCELAQLAQRHQLEVKMAAINANGDDVSLSGSQEPPKDAIGLTVSITDKGNVGGHFLTGSDKLTPQAEQYFAELAKIYQPTRSGEDELDKSKQAQMVSEAKKKKLVLIGHTDDTGSSALNAELSERRARAVAQYLKSHGIGEEMLYYQGAGETYPIADNRTELGRAQNRRVEIVEIADETQLKKFLETRTPKYEFYRQGESVLATTATDKKPAEGKVASTNTQAKTPEKGNSPKANTATKPVDTPPAQSARTMTEAKPTATPSPAMTTPPVLAGTPALPIKPVIAKSMAMPAIDFGGTAVKGQNVGLEMGSVVQEAAGFSPIGKAWADDVPVKGGCSGDRPRVAGQVKALRDGQVYATSDYLPGLYNTSWVEKVNGHLIALNKVAVLRQGAAPARLPELLVYPNYKNDANAKATIRMTPAVNTYKGSKGLLYRVFVKQGNTLDCVDLVLPYAPPFVAKGGYVYQTKPDGLYRSAYTPKMVN